MNRFTRWQTWLAVFALGAVTLVGACTDEAQRDSMVVGPQLGLTGEGYNDDLVTDEVVNIKGALWISGVVFKVGTGVINPFLGIQNRLNEKGFNTDGKFNYDQTRTQFTNPLPLNELPTIEEEFTQSTTTFWRELILDANEANSPPAALFSIEDFNLWLCTDPDTPTFEDYATDVQGNAACTSIYHFGFVKDGSDPENRYIATDGKTNGSGNSLDYRILIPDQIFEDFVSSEPGQCDYNPDAEPCGFWVVLWNDLGLPASDYVVGSTFEEYSTIIRPYITVTKDAVPTVDREHYWDLTKAVDPMECDAYPGEDCDFPFDYTIEAVYDSNVLVNPNLTGTIYIDNPSEDPVVINTVMDKINGTPVPAVCPETLPYTLAVGGHLECTYDLPLVGDVPTGVLTNTATVTLETTDGLGLGPRTATFDFTFDGLEPTQERSCNVNDPTICTDWGVTDVNVIDDFATAVADFLPDGCDTDPACTPDGPWTTSPENTLTITYSRVGFCEADEGGVTKTWTNTAQIQELELDADATVTINCDSYSISGYKWHDLNADGIWNAGEPPLQSWEIGITGPDAFSDNTFTDVNGYYEFTGLNAGAHVVSEVCLADWYQSFPNPTNGCGSGVHNITLADGIDRTDINFGNWTTATKSGTKFHDLNANGVDDGEPGLGGWVIYVDYNDDGVNDGDEPEATTASDGTYTITGIVPGTWKVKEEAQTDWTCSYPNPCYHEELFNSDDDLTGNDFGNWTTATKSGMKFHDLNANGEKDGSDTGLGGWVIYVDYNDDGVNDGDEPEATTASDGAYTITGIVPGTWKVKEEAQADWTCSYPDPCYHEELFNSDDDLTGNDFGNWTTATKSGMKFKDLNANGVKDGGDTGLGGWVIYVDYNDDGVNDGDEPEATTASDGAYTITGIVPGTWKVKEEAQANWTCSYPNAGPGDANTITDAVTSSSCYHEELFNSDDDLTGNDFGNWQSATKSGMKFHDLNANGVKDGGDTGLGGWVIYVDYNDDGVNDGDEPEATTASDGTYTITGIAPGTWKVKEEAQADWTCSYPDPCYHEEIFTSGAAQTENDFGNWTTATKSGMKFHDLNANGAKDGGDTGLGGWVIYVDYNDDGVNDGDEPEATTASDGAYTITGIVPGTWKVKEEAQTDWTCSYPDPCYHEELFNSDDDLTGNDFGNWRPATKSGMKFHDLNANGAKDGGDTGLGGWVIYVDYNDDGVNDGDEPEATTASDGAYTITGIVPGTWKVKEEAQTDWTCSYPDPCYHEELFNSDDDLTGNDFGNWTPATKSGMKFHDLNANGAKDGSDTGLGGWVIYVDYNDDGVNDGDEPEATTASDGAYTITGIVPGTWKVKEEAQADWTCSYPDPCYHEELFNSDDDLTGNDFGNWQYATKSGSKFYDLNNNGAWDTGEDGLPGWTITLVGTDGMGVPVDLSTATAADGSYSFVDLVPGDYVVCEVMQTDWTQTFPASGFACSNGTLGYSFTLISGQEEVGNDFGNYVPLNRDTAYAMNNGLEVCFLDQTLVDETFNNWGWTNGPVGAGTYTWDVWAGASDCDPAKGVKAGTVTFTISGGTISTYAWNLNTGFFLDSDHVYAGDEPFPMKPNGQYTVSPGQYTIGSDLNGDGWIYVIFHAVVLY